MAQTTLSTKVAPAREADFRSMLAEVEFDFSDAAHAFWRGRGPGCIATFYRSGKLVLQGAQSYTVAALLDVDVPEPETPGDAYEKALALHPDPKPALWVGSDEVGKGDYFGPLIVVAARVRRDRVALLAELGATDSKKLTDKRIPALARDLRQAVDFEIVAVGPETYNRMYRETPNLNRLLAWAHATAIRTLLEKAPADYVLTDQFANPLLIERRLKDLPDSVRLDQRTKAESDPAVATASIIARAEFLHRMDKLSDKAGMVLPKGAGSPVLAAAKRLVAARGPEVLERFAKIHFKTTEQVLGGLL